MTEHKPGCTYNDCDPCSCGASIAEEPNEGLCKNTIRIISACKLVIQSYEDYETDTMTTPITIVQACEQLGCLLENIKKGK